jgi:hypothetical protein
LWTDGYFYATGIESHTIDDLIGMNGERPPNAYNVFKVLTVLVSDNITSENNYQELVGDVKWFANMPGYGDKYSGLYNFSKATYGRGSLVVTGLMDSLK